MVLEIIVLEIIVHALLGAGIACLYVLGKEVYQMVKERI